MIEFIDISLSFNSKLILSNITVTIPDNCKTVIIGRSGCGKTVFMKTLAGLYQPLSGTISIDNQFVTHDKIHHRPEALNKIAMVFQNAALLDSFTVYQNIALPLYDKKKSSMVKINQDVLEMLSFVGLEQCADMFPAELSGGMRKRIGLARALITNPKYLILDEPTTGLDPFTSDEVIKFLKRVIDETKVIPITITHDPYCINELSDYVIMMDDGKVIFSGHKNELIKLTGTEILRFYNSFFLI